MPFPEMPFLFRRRERAVQSAEVHAYQPKGYFILLLHGENKRIESGVPITIQKFEDFDHPEITLLITSRTGLNP